MTRERLLSRDDLSTMADCGRKTRTVEEAFANLAVTVEQTLQPRDQQ